MADDLSFTISANDQASKAVETVQKKIQGFGSDLAKMALGVAGPMALVSAGIGLVMDKWNEYKQAKIDAKNEAAKAEEEIQNAATEKEKEKIKERLDAYKKAEAEKTAALKAEEERRKKKLSLREEIQSLQEENTRGGKPLEGADLLNKLGDDVRDAYNKKRSYNITNRATDDMRLEAQLDYEKKLNAFLKEKNKQETENTKDKKDNVAKPEETKAVKDTIKVTVSSLREIGGGFAGENLDSGIERQIELAQKSTDLLGKIAENTSYMKTDSSGNPIDVGNTNFTITLPGGKEVSSVDFFQGNF